MTPFVALCAWSFAILLLSFYLGRRCGWLDERERCLGVVREEREHHVRTANQSAVPEDAKKQLLGELWIFDGILGRIRNEKTGRK